MLLHKQEERLVLFTQWMLLNIIIIVILSCISWMSVLYKNMVCCRQNTCLKWTSIEHEECPYDKHVYMYCYTNTWMCPVSNVFNANWKTRRVFIILFVKEKWIHRDVFVSLWWLILMYYLYMKCITTSWNLSPPHEIYYLYIKCITYTWIVLPLHEMYYVYMSF